MTLYFYIIHYPHLCLSSGTECTVFFLDPEPFDSATGLGILFITFESSKSKMSSLWGHLQMDPGAE